MSSKQKNYFSFQNPALRGIACLKKAMITGMDNPPEALRPVRDKYL